MDLNSKGGGLVVKSRIRSDVRLDSPARREGKERREAYGSLDEEAGPQQTWTWDVLRREVWTGKPSRLLSSIHVVGEFPPHFPGVSAAHGAAHGARMDRQLELSDLNTGRRGPRPEGTPSATRAASALEAGLRLPKRPTLRRSRIGTLARFGGKPVSRRTASPWKGRSLLASDFQTSRSLEAPRLPSCGLGSRRYVRNVQGRSSPGLARPSAAGRVPEDAIQQSGMLPGHMAWFVHPW